jgi:CDP-glucose 4,6-dehydratase
MSTLAEAYRGRSVLVTGHTGFKGSWLSLWLGELGAQVIGYALEAPSDPNLFALARVAEKIEHNHGDVRDLDHITGVVAEARPDLVFHLAAQAIVRESYETPLETFDTNVMGTATVLEAVRASGHDCTVVAVTSDKCYENSEWIYGYREIDGLGGGDPYSASKSCAELLVASWNRSFFQAEASPVRLASARAGNVIGGGDWGSDRILPDCISALCANRPVGVRNPGSVRPWQHVLEPLSGYLWLAARLASPEGRARAGAWNFGPAVQSVCSVEELVKKVIECWGAGEYEDVSSPDAPREAGLLALSWEKAYHELGWQPVWGLDTAVGETVAWYRAWHEGEAHLDDLCVRQIRSFTKRAAAMGIPWA